MTEQQFIHRNQADWQALEKLLDAPNPDPDALQALFVKVSGDLSFARSRFPRRAVRAYLNTLVNRVFDSMRIKEDPRWLARIQRFYTHTLPREVLHNWKAFALSLLTFASAVIIGVYASSQNPTFLAEVVGEDYLRMTEENIAKGDPMAVYKSSKVTGMFLGITLNNCLVALNTFALGLFAGLGTLFILIKNGIMLGAFQMFFYQKGLFLTSFLTIWIHGTIEISCIVIAGAAGLILGKGIIFPGSYSRRVSIATGALRALIVLLSVLPLLVVAGFLEGFVTRMDLPALVKAFIILISLIVIITIYVVQPYRYYRQYGWGEYRPRLPFEDGETEDLPHDLPALEVGVVRFRQRLGGLLGRAILPGWGLSLALFMGHTMLLHSMGQLREAEQLTAAYPLWLLMSLLVVAVVFTARAGLVWAKQPASIGATIKHLSRYPLPTLGLGIALVGCLAYVPGQWMLLPALLLPFGGLWMAQHAAITDEAYTTASIGSYLSFHYSHLTSFIKSQFIQFLAYLLVLFLINSQISSIFHEMLIWLDLFADPLINTLLINYMLALGAVAVIWPLMGSIFIAHSQDIRNQKEAVDLHQRIDEWSRQLSPEE